MTMFPTRAVDSRMIGPGTLDKKAPTESKSRPVAGSCRSNESRTAAPMSIRISRSKYASLSFVLVALFVDPLADLVADRRGRPPGLAIAMSAARAEDDRVAEVMPST